MKTSTDPLSPSRVESASRYDILAQRFHEVYEMLAPLYKWETQECSRVPWLQLPPEQRGLMRETVKRVLDEEALCATRSETREPDADCITTHDGGCIAEKCMHTEYPEGGAHPREEAPRAFSSAEGEAEALREELKVSDYLLEERNRVLRAIPECEAHGNDCVPHALEWIEKAKALQSAEGTLSEERLAALVEEAYTAEAQGWDIKKGVEAVLRLELSGLRSATGLRQEQLRNSAKDALRKLEDISRFLPNSPEGDDLAEGCGTIRIVLEEIVRSDSRGNSG